MKLAFKPILRLEIWHDYHLDLSRRLDGLPAGYDVSDAIALIPTQECQRVLRNLRWVFRNQPYGAILLAQVDTTAEPPDTNGAALIPIVPVDAATRLTFWLVVRDRHFTNYTNLPLDTPSSHCYYFSNQTGNQVGDRLFLTQPLSSYQSGTQYPLGHLVSYRKGKESMTLEAVRYQSAASRSPRFVDRSEGENGSSSKPKSSTGEWMQLPHSQYVSANDTLPHRGWSYPVALPEAQPGADLRFSLVNISGQESFAHTVKVPADHPVGTPLSIYLNFTGQLPGAYRLLVNGDLLDQFVLFDPMGGCDAFGLVEFSLAPNVVSPAFQLLEDREESPRLRPKTYTIRFKNRATRWRYRCDRPHGFTPETLPNTLQIIDAQTYATPYPIGLCRQPNRFLTDGNRKPLPAPGVSMIKPLIETAADGSRRVTAIFSDTYL